MSCEFVVVSLRVVVCLWSAAAHGISSLVCGRFFLIRLARLPYFLLSWWDFDEEAGAATQICPLWSFEQECAKGKVARIEYYNRVPSLLPWWDFAEEGCSATQMCQLWSSEQECAKTNVARIEYYNRLPYLLPWWDFAEEECWATRIWQLCRALNKNVQKDT
jgi:hypothetical protein